MQLTAQPTATNRYPVLGIFIEGNSPRHWAEELQRIGIVMQQVTAYPLPGPMPNSVWGCLLHVHVPLKGRDIGANGYAQLAHGLLFLPERTELWPAATVDEMARLLMNKKHVFHPAFGWAELGEPLQWASILQAPTYQEQAVVVPSVPPAVPVQVRGFRVFAPPTAQALESLGAVEGKDIDHRPLSPLEHAKMEMLKRMLQPGSKFPDLFPALTRKMQEELDELMRRNQSKLEKLLEMLKKNPSEGLQYAIPLDPDGTGRGGGLGELGLDKLWGSFGLFGGGWIGGSGGGGSAPLRDDAFEQLKQQYHETAKALIAQKDYRKAAFVYLKLLKNPHLAAQTLEQGQLWAEAAAIYLEHLKDKKNAARCYENGLMLQEAIELHIELGLHEHAGDLLLKLGKYDDAMAQYQIVVNNYKGSRQYVNASLIYQKKMNNPDAGQALLLEGWRVNYDATNCLMLYYANIQAEHELLQNIESVYSQDVTERNRVDFLGILKHQYKYDHCASAVRNMAYEIVAQEAIRNSAIVEELRTFAPSNEHLGADTARFRAGKVRRGLIN